MYIFKRNQIIITALVIMIVIAGYLNFVDNSGNSDSQYVTNDGFNEEFGDFDSALVPNNDIMSDIEPVISENVQGQPEEKSTDENSDGTEIKDDKAELSKDDENKKPEPGAAVFVNNPNVSTNYFVQAKIEREQVRAKRKDDLYDMINNQNMPKEEKAKASQNLLEIIKRVEIESEAESLIEAKGFNEVYVRIGDDSIDVVVDSPVLSEADIAQIADIVKRKTGVSFEKIKISKLK